MSDLIDRQDVIDALGDEPEVWTGKDEYAQGLNNQWHYDRNAILRCPPAQPEPHYDEWCDDCKEYDKERHSCPRWNKVIHQTLEDMKIIRCKECKWFVDTGDDFMCGNQDGWVVGTSSNFGCVLAERRQDE